MFVPDQMSDRNALIGREKRGKDLSAWPFDEAVVLLAHQKPCPVRADRMISRDLGESL